MIPETFKIWWLALRPKTLGAAIAPVLVGTGMAFADDKGHVLAALAALLGALLIQVGTNFANDYFDFVKGADTEERLGPIRATQAGLVTPEVMRRAYELTFGLAFLLGIYLVTRGGWPIVIIGLCSIAAGIAYTGGPYPLAYHGLGDVFVLVFFGPVAVGGTYYVQAQDIHSTVLLAGLGPGLIATALLAVNNLRDADTDEQSNKRTLAVRFGKDFARHEYILAVGMALLLPVLLVLESGSHWGALLALLSLGVGRLPIQQILRGTEGIELNQTLALTGKFLLLYSLLLALGWLLS